MKREKRERETGTRSPLFVYHTGGNRCHVVRKGGERENHRKEEWRKDEIEEKRWLVSLPPKTKTKIQKKLTHLL